MLNLIKALLITSLNLKHFKVQLAVAILWQQVQSLATNKRSKLSCPQIKAIKRLKDIVSKPAQLLAEMQASIWMVRQMLEALEKVDQAMPFPVARQAITAARARLGEKT